MNSAFPNSGLKCESPVRSTYWRRLHSSSLSARRLTQLCLPSPLGNGAVLNHGINCLARFGETLALHANPNQEQTQASGSPFVSLPSPMMWP